MLVGFKFNCFLSVTTPNLTSTYITYLSAIKQEMVSYWGESE